MAFKRQVIEDLLKSPEWVSRLEKATTTKEVQQIICEFAKTKGFKVLEVPI